MKLLIGFDNEAAINMIRKEFEKRGQPVEIIQKHSKVSVVEYVNRHFDCHMVLLMENHIQGKYTADELAKITDINENLNVVLITDESRKGSVFLKQLYSAGIYGVIYQSVADKKGVSIPKIVDLLLHKRSKPEARQYYGIDEIAVEIEPIPLYVLQQQYDIIRNGQNFGSNVGVRFFNVAQQLTTPQNAELIRNMPSELLNQLKQYEEFYDIVQQIEEYGISINMNLVRPKELKRGSVQIGRNLLGDTGKEISMGQMNFNEVSERFKKQQRSGQDNNYSSSSFHSMPLMQQSNTKTNRTNEGTEFYDHQSITFQQPLLSQREQTSFRNSRQQYTSMNERFAPEETSYSNPKRKKSDSKKMMIIGGVVVCVVLVCVVGAVSLLKSRPTVIAKEQVTTVEQSAYTDTAEAESYLEEIEANDPTSEAYTHMEEGFTETVEYVEENNNEADYGGTLTEVVAEEGTEMPLMDVTSIVSDGSVVNQLVVDNIMSQYEDDYNFVVYGLPDEKGSDSTVSEEEGKETGDTDTEETGEEVPQDKYYTVSLNKPGSITFTEIALK